MGDTTSIEWTDTTWNVVTGCTKVSPGCDRCYAETFAERFRGKAGHHFENGFDLTLRPERLALPLKWRKPRRVFVNSMSDLFHKDIPDEYIARVWAVMAQTPQHTYQILTKRHGRMRSLLGGASAAGLQRLLEATHDEATAQALYGAPWPLPNVWLGVSVEDQQRADLRIPPLLETAAAVRFLSCEPLLGPVDLRTAGCPATVWDGPYRMRCSLGGDGERCSRHGKFSRRLPGGIGWVIVGGESGHGARPMHPQWARDLRDQCTAADVPFFFKQHGEWISAAVTEDPQFTGGRVFTDPRGARRAPVVREPGPSGTYRNGTSRLLRPGETVGELSMLDADTIAIRVGKKAAGRELDGRTWDQFPTARPGGRVPDAG